MRYLSLAWVALRRSIAVSAQYRADFVIGGLMSVAWTAIGIVPLVAAMRGRHQLAGWTFEEALVVTGCFTLLRGVLEGAVNPSLLLVVEQIRQGTLDFVLLKPADAQFLVSTSRFEPFRVLDLAAGLGIVAWAFARMHRLPSLAGVLVAATLLVGGVALLYSLWILVVSAAFWVVRLDNLAYVLSSLVDFARWPRSVFHGAVALLFTFVLPIATMTSFPAEALLGRLSLAHAAGSLAGSMAFAWLARRAWLRALGHYASASS